MSRLGDLLWPTPPTVVPSIIERPVNGTGLRDLQASAQIVAMGDRGESSRIAKLRRQQAWQPDAWLYRDAIGEIRYAMLFLAHALSRMRLFAAVQVEDQAEPVPIDEADAMPAGLAASAKDALDRLGGGSSIGLGKLCAALGENLEVPGEAYLLGRTVAGGEEWSIRSTDELVVKDGGYALSPSPGAKGPDLEPLPPDSFIARLWTPHPRYSRLADSPMRSLVLSGVCEELLLVSRMIRRASKSRLAGNGILVVDQSLDFPRPAGNDDADDPGTGAAFSTLLTQAMSEPIRDESAASAMVPVVVEADLAEGRRAMEHIKLFGDLDPSLLDRGDKALRRIGMSLDVPPEIITGMADVNHWTAWQIEDSTFRSHVEPLVLRIVDAFTLGYLHAMLEAAGFAPEIVRRVVIWYDPTELVTNPNRAADAEKGHGSLVLSDETLVRELGFNPDTDMPTDEERMRRLAEQRGSIDPPLTEAMLKAAMLEITLMVERSRTEPDPGAPTPEPLPAQPAPADAGPAPIPEPAVTPPPSTTAAALPDTRNENPVAGPVLHAHLRESQRLARLERGLRDRLTAAADAAMRRAMERAGNRVKTQANRYAASRSVVAAVGPREAYHALPAELRASLGLDPAELLDGAWTDLREQWDTWTVAAREEAVALALQMAGVDLQDEVIAERLAVLTRDYAATADDAWAFMVAGLDRMATAALTDPDAVPDPESPEPADFPITGGGVLLSLIRGALSILGGVATTAAGVTRDGTPTQNAERLAGLTGGELLEGFMRDQGVETIAYEWVYGISVRHFEPHRALDGVRFARFGDPILANPGGPGAWPFETLAPGDHRGCHCDAMPVYADGLSAADAAQQLGDATYDPTYLEVLRGMAEDDIAAGRLDTSPIATLMEAERVAASRPSKGEVPTPITDQVRLAGGRVPKAGQPWQQATPPETVPPVAPYADLVDRLDTLSMDELDELAGMYPAVFTDPALSERFEARMDLLDAAERDAREPQPQSVQDWYAAQMARDAEVIRLRDDALPPKRKGASALELKREEYELWLNGQMLAAEEATAGNIVNAAGKARGTSFEELYSLPAAQAVKLASDEIIRWWTEDESRRMTWTEWRSGRRGEAFTQALKRADTLRSGRPAAARARAGGALSASDKLARDQRRIARARAAEQAAQEEQ